jgi:hypothetical protein
MVTTMPVEREIERKIEQKKGIMYNGCCAAETMK